MTKFGYDSLNFAKMYTLQINAKRENFAFLDNMWLQSLNLSKLPIYDTFASLLCLLYVFDRVFTSLCFQLKDVYILTNIFSHYKLCFF